MHKKTIVKYGLIPLAAVLMILYSALFGSAQQPVRIVCDLWPPYQYMEGKTLTGFSTEIVKAVYSEMGITAEQITAVPWKRALSIVESGHADALFSANLTQDRTTFARYPDEPIFDAPWVIWTRKGDVVTSLEALKGKRVGVVLGYSYTTEFWKFIETYCNVERVSTDEVNFKKLEFGRLDATVAEYGNGIHLTRKLGLKSVTPNPKVEIKRDGLYMLFNREHVDEAIVNDFSNTLRKFKTTPAYRALREKYFGPDFL